MLIDDSDRARHHVGRSCASLREVRGRSYRKKYRTAHLRNSPPITHPDYCGIVTPTQREEAAGGDPSCSMEMRARRVVAVVCSPPVGRRSSAGLMATWPQSRNVRQTHRSIASLATTHDLTGGGRWRKQRPRCRPETGLVPGRFLMTSRSPLAHCARDRRFAWRRPRQSRSDCAPRA